MGKGGQYGGGGMLEVSISESGVTRTSEIFNLKLDCKNKTKNYVLEHC